MPSRLSLALLLLSPVTLLSTGRAQTASCTFSYFVPPAPYTAAFEATGINHYGTVVGQASSSTVVKAMIHGSGGTQIYAVPGADYTSLSKRNSAGTSVGFYIAKGSSNTQGLVLTSALHFTTLNYPGAQSTKLWGINKYNTIVGSFIQSTGGNQQGFRYSGGRFSPIQFPGAISTVPHAVNDNGVIVGIYWLGSFENPPHGFILQSGSYRSVDVGASGGTQPRDISNSGTIVLASNALYKNGVSKQVVVPGSFETFVGGINDLNQVTGEANFQASNNNFTWKAFTAHCQQPCSYESALVLRKSRSCDLSLLFKRRERRRLGVPKGALVPHEKVRIEWPVCFCIVQTCPQARPATRSQCSLPGHIAAAFLPNCPAYTSKNCTSNHRIRRQGIDDANSLAACLATE